MNILKPNISKAISFSRMYLKNILIHLKVYQLVTKATLCFQSIILLDLLNLIYKPFKKVYLENLWSFTLNDSSSGNSSPTP